MTGSRTCLALLAGLGLLLACGAEDAQCARAPPLRREAAEAPGRQDLGSAILQILVARQISAVEDSFLVPLKEGLDFSNPARRDVSPSNEMAVNR